MRGTIDAQGLPRLVVEVRGARGSSRLNALLDTGFTGDLCIPIPVAVQLGLELIGYTELELADGTVRSELPFAGTTRVNDGERHVDILLTHSAEPLVGLKFLRDSKLTLDFRRQAVRVEFR